MSAEVTARELERIATALSLPADFAYAPPHVFPMSVPRFSSSPAAARHSPRLTELGLVDQDHEQIFLTDTGKLVYDLATLALYPPAMRQWLGERRTQALSRLGAAGTAPV